MRLRLFGFIFSTLAALILPGSAAAQLYMSGSAGAYSNLESDGLAGRFALGAAPLDWIKVEGAALASGHNEACCSIALDATGWLTVLGVGPVKMGLGGGGGFTGALQAGHQHHGGGLFGLRQGRIGPAHHLNKLLVDKLDELLIGADATHHIGAEGFLAHLSDEAFDHRQADVGIQQGAAHVF